MTDVRPDRPVPDHAAHDRLLIARAAADDVLTQAEQATVAERLATCPACATLHADLVAMTAGLRDLPVPRRPRDFRLSPEVLVGGASWRERLAGILVGRAMRPLAAAICALGLLLAVTGAVLPRSTGTATLSDTGAGQPVAAPGAQGPGATAAPTAYENDTRSGGGVGPSPAGDGKAPPPSLASPPSAVYGQATGAPGDLSEQAVPPTSPGRVAAPGPDAGSLLIGGGLVLFVTGGGAFLLLRRRPA